jgi:hypothetical protein
MRRIHAVAARSPRAMEFPEAPPAGTVPTCEQAGILGALAGVAGSLAALEVIGWISIGSSSIDVR